MTLMVLGKENNVDNTGMRFDKQARNALAFVTLRADGECEFMFFHHPSADMLLTEAELDTDLIQKSTIFHYGSIRSILSYDPNLRLPLWPSPEAARKGILRIWDQADVIKISEDEIMFLTGGDDPYDDKVVLTKLFHPNLNVDTTGAGDAFVGGLLLNLAKNTQLFKRCIEVYKYLWGHYSHREMSDSIIAF
uniref:Carbohydrate kinase PfkB domain-containing protein n=4 Tax=Lactuca sativa TaxID=4236 RepID=A0A9R1VTS9_LACSA|nr:hypothetical protein LSAT_V11C400160370 [Lactuca sativa]KAJ0211579.1 hypothetical protein LSAT_V11C400160400 [Lactuca sativa]KAJ0212270.1 hypothetical protein LSAT_V11C400160430 [Lactuca sativa]KAJ0212978.1 hypothetical protein LSAT_V11C400160460 [Lactuca sativa]